MNGLRPVTVGVSKALLNLRQQIGLPCEPQKSSGRTRVSATFEGPSSEADLKKLPPPTGHRKESEPDEATAKGQDRLYNAMPASESDSRSVLFLQRVPAVLLGRFVFLREGEREGD